MSAGTNSPSPLCHPGSFKIPSPPPRNLRTGHLHPLHFSVSALHEILPFGKTSRLLCVAGSRSLQASSDMEKHLPEPHPAFCWGPHLAPISPAPRVFAISFPAPPPLPSWKSESQRPEASSTLPRAHLFLFPRGLLEAEDVCLFINPGAGEMVQFS